MNMKKIIAVLSLIAVIIPSLAFATVTSWDYASGLLQPLQSQWGARVRVDHLFATSTVNTSWFPVLAFSSATGTNLTITGTCTGCGSGSSFPWPFTKQDSGAQATTTIMQWIGGFVSSASSTMSSVDINGGAIDGTAIGASSASTGVFSNASTTNFNVGSNHISFGSNYISATTSASFRVASTTLDAAGASFNRATTTLHLANWPERRIIRSVFCTATSTGGVLFHIGDGTNFSAGVFCDNLRKQTVLNYTLEPFEDFVVMIGKASTTPHSVTITTLINKLSD